MIEAARCETAFTHPPDEVVESAEFFCHVVLAIRAGADISNALESVAISKTWTLPENWLAVARIPTYRVTAA